MKWFPVKDSLDAYINQLISQHMSAGQNGVVYAFRLGTEHSGVFVPDADMSPIEFGKYAQTIAIQTCRALERKVNNPLLYLDGNFLSQMDCPDKAVAIKVAWTVWTEGRR